jgi:cysteinyl-tRNA synthetase
VERGFDPLSFRWVCFQTQYRSEMDFTWDAMATADQRVKQLRHRMAEWAPGASELDDAARAFDARFREALADDLAMPKAVVIVNDLVSSKEVADEQKYALLASWDFVLGLDLERDATAGWEPTAEMRALVTERDAARAAKDFPTSDRIRDALGAMGLEVMDTAEGTRIRPRD